MRALGCVQGCLTAVPTQMAETGLGSRSHSRGGLEGAEGLRFRDALERAGLGGWRAPGASLGTEATARLSQCMEGPPHPSLLLLVIAANELACRGLDHLEEKIPALQYPPEKVSPSLFSHTLWSLPWGKGGCELLMP